MLFSEPKIPQWFFEKIRRVFYCYVSVLFSEPKIPQSSRWSRRHTLPRCFSALQRAENSSIIHCVQAHNALQAVSVLFSEPKIPQFGTTRRINVQYSTFQCSSASRKFLNYPVYKFRILAVEFQCSSASRKFLNSL